MKIAIDSEQGLYYNNLCVQFGGVAQLVRAHGSYPWCHWFKSSHRHQSFFQTLQGLENKQFTNAPLAQLVEQLTLNQRAWGSSP
jgi:hypothetical protein